jgi:hypothetical protein
MFDKLLLIFGLSLIGHAAYAEQTSRTEQSTCQQLEGEYTFKGITAEGSRTPVLGMEPNIVQVLKLNHGLAYNEQIERFKVVRDHDRYLLELYTGQGAGWRLAFVGAKDTVYCQDGQLVIERSRRTKASTVYEYSQIKHRIRADERGGLEVKTEVTGSFRTTLLNWDREPEQSQFYFLRKVA